MSNAKIIQNKQIEGQQIPDQSANDDANTDSALSSIVGKDRTAICGGIARNLVSPEKLIPNRLVGLNAAFKRLEDIFLSGVALILLMPLMVVISIVIKLDSTGPALFSQSRYGRNKEIIKVYKFRTMYQNQEGSFKQARKGDPRVTRVGLFLRRTSLDELPQLFNVIQGSMSLVGPRPHPLELDDSFKYVIPALSSRYAVKPGITGWAQINGYRGETSQVGDMAARIEHDREYIRKWSIWLDFKIVLKTLINGWTHENAY